ncbi:MAG: adenine phosphoribosyltransferase [Planctomycetota bacterium]
MSLSDEIRAVIRDVPDFPEPGVVFKDITPLLLDGALYERVTDWMVEQCRGERPTHVLGIESRGFLFAAPVAHRLGAGLVPARKPGKLPWRTAEVSYELEYGTDALEVHEDACGKGSRVLIVDDLLATGGTAQAACRLVEKLGGEVSGLCMVIELGFLKGRERLPGRRVHSLLLY